MPVLCKKPPAKCFSPDYTPSTQMIKRLNGLNKNNSLHWKLTDAELFYIQTHYPRYKITPSVYIIKTEFNFECLSNAPGIIKKIENGAQKGKRFICSTLKKNEVDILNEHGIFYKPVKYLITSS